MNIKARIIDNTKLELLEDAKKGDIIDLKELVDIDLSFLNKKIENEATSLYQKNLNEQFNLKKNEILSQKQQELTDLKNEKDKEITNLKNQIEKIKQEITSEYNLKLKDLENKINNKDVERNNALNELNLKNQNLINELKAKHDAEILKLQSQISTKDLEKQNEIDKIKNQAKEDLQAKNTEIQNLNNEHNLNLLKLENEHKEVTSSLEAEINNLKLQKSALNVKKLGEELERWCDEEYKNYALIGFKNCTWEKDNTSIKDEDDKKGTKADYIFKVFLDDKLDTVLASVCCEMKNEDPNSTNKKKNSDHYAKLDKDRIKKGCEYALLVSELEWDTANDAPIKLVPGYDKMYLVRPPYFIAFLAIIFSLAEKYRNILLAKNKENITLKDKQALIEEFDSLIKTYLNNPIDSLNKRIEDILASSEAITKANQKIKDICNEIINKTINTIKEKINTLEIKKLPSLYKKLDKVND